MYTLGVRRDFIARHFLIGGDWGPENYPNSHHYVLELQLKGKELNQHGYLVDRELLQRTDAERQARIRRFEPIHRAFRADIGNVTE